MHKKITVMLLCLLLILALLPVTGIAQENKENNDTLGRSVDNWPMFRHDILNTGYSTAEAPDTDTIKWTFDVGAGSSSAIAVDDMVFVGTDESNLTVVNITTGQILTRYSYSGTPIKTSPTIVDGVVYLSNTLNLFALTSLLSNVTTIPTIPFTNNGTEQNVTVNFTSVMYPLNISFELYNESNVLVGVKIEQITDSSDLPLNYTISLGMNNGK